MSEAHGRIELDRDIDSIVVGIRHRKDLGDIPGLMKSIEEVGLLQPITITPDGVLVCGRRRLEALRRLGWRTLKVWVRSGISDQLSHLLAQINENEQRKPLNLLETESLYREVKELEKEEAARRQEASRFGAAPCGEMSGAAGHAAPRGSGDARVQASLLVTGNPSSYYRLEQLGWLKDVAADQTQIPHVRLFATNAVAAIKEGAPVEPAFKRVRAALELASKPQVDQPETEEDLARASAEALERVRQHVARRGARGLRNSHTEVPHYRSLRSFILTWSELEGWSALYSIDQIATSLEAEEWARFERVVTETVQFADMVREARRALVPTA